MNSVLQRVYEIGIIPVIAFNSVDEALPLCKALMAGGLPAAEVTFRTACAEDCIKKIHEELPDMLLGAGTVLTKDQADRAMAAGASFIVAPALTPRSASTSSTRAHHDARHRHRRRDAAGHEHGLRGRKFFPAEPTAAWTS